MSSVDAFDYRLCPLEATAGLEVGVGEALQRNERRNQTVENVLMAGIVEEGSLIYLEKVRVR